MSLVKGHSILSSLDRNMLMKETDEGEFKQVTDVVRKNMDLIYITILQYTLHFIRNGMIFSQFTLSNQRVYRL